jgi:hypothetical protein
VSFISSTGEAKTVSIGDQSNTEKSNLVKKKLNITSPTSTSSPMIDTPVTSAIEIDDPKRKLTKAEAEELKATEKEYKEALAFVKDMIAPAMMQIDARKLQIGDTYIRTIFTYAYPDVLE